MKGAKILNCKRISLSCLTFAMMGFMGVGISSCAEVNVPTPRNLEIPTPIQAEKRREAVNERPDSVVYLPLGEDVLVPERMVGQDLPREQVGPFELRGETLAGALQLILADYDISIAFETQRGMTEQVTVANLKGPLNKVVDRVCSLADLYCSYEDGAIVVKDTQTFTVSLPPLGDEDTGDAYINDVITGLSAVIGGSGSSPVSDPSTRTIIYSATQRTSKLASNYFQRLRASTAMIVFETYIWEVSLDADNSTGIKWDEVGRLADFGDFATSFNVAAPGLSPAINPVSIGLPTTGSINDASKLLQFLSTFGAVKSISQPQITVLSGASAELRVADTQNYVSEVTQTISGDNTATSVTTDTVESGFTLNIGSSWDKSTVYANVSIDLSNVDDIENFTFAGSGGEDDSSNTRIQLPQTTERELKTQIRVRPGDSVLIAGLVRENDNFDERGLGFMKPVLPDQRTAQVENLELVIMLRPRVIVYTAQAANNYRGPSNNLAQNVLSSSLQKRVPVYQEPVAAQPIPRRQSVETFTVEEPRQEEPLAAIISEVTPVESIVPPPTYQAPQAVPRLASPAPVRRAPVPELPQSFDAPAAVTQRGVPSYNASNGEATYSDSGYRSTGGLTRNKDLYTPRASSASSSYNGGYVSGRANLSGVNNVGAVPMPSNTTLSAPVYQAPAPAVQSSSVYPSAQASSPLSPNIYNQAQKIDVYDVYSGSQ